VSQFGVVGGYDGQGTGKEEYQRDLEKHSLYPMLMSGLDACKQYE